MLSEIEKRWRFQTKFEKMQLEQNSWECQVLSEVLSGWGTWLVNTKLIHYKTPTQHTRSRKIVHCRSQYTSWWRNNGDLSSVYTCYNIYSGKIWEVHRPTMKSKAYNYKHISITCHWKYYILLFLYYIWSIIKWNIDIFCNIF